MPSFVSHLALGALIAFFFLHWRKDQPFQSVRKPVTIIAWFLFASIVPDLDYAIRLHREFGHNIFTAWYLPSMFAVITVMWLDRAEDRALAMWLPAAVATHLWADLLAPVGSGRVPFLWPLSTDAWAPTGNVWRVSRWAALDHTPLLFLFPYLETRISRVLFSVSEDARTLPLGPVTLLAVAVARPLFQSIGLWLLLALSFALPASRVQPFS